MSGKIIDFQILMMYFPDTMKKLLLSITLLFLFSVISYAQTSNQPSDLNWDELKKVQTEERMKAEETQKETLKNVIEMQKEQMKAMSVTGPSSTQFIELANQQREERQTLSKIHSEERVKLATIQAEERKFFLQNKSLTKP